MTYENLLAGPPPVLLPADPAAEALESGVDPRQVARTHPESPFAWATLAETALDGGDDLDAYAYARVGYHRSLDALRRNGWKGFGAVPYEHEPNRGYLRAVAALVRASDRIGDTGEAQRCRELLDDSDPQARPALRL